MKIISLSILIFVSFQKKNIEKSYTDGIQLLKKLSLLGIICFLFDLVMFIISQGRICSYIIKSSIAGNTLMFAAGAVFAYAHFINFTWLQSITNDKNK